MEMEQSKSTILDGKITGIKLVLATAQEIRKASISGFPISHASQLSNPFLGLPLENGKCESCGADRVDQCEGHFGYIELPVSIYHPSHISELKRFLNTICLNCLKVKDKKVQVPNNGITECDLSSCCKEASQVTVDEKTTEGARYLVLNIKQQKYQDGAWNFLAKYGYRYGDRHFRPLLPCEVMVILSKLSMATMEKLSAKGVSPQDGYIMKYIPVPPNCLSVLDVSDGVTDMSSDKSVTMLKKILRKIEIINKSRSGTPNFETYKIESNDLQIAFQQCLDARGTSKASREVDNRFGICKGSTKSRLEKMKTWLISKASGFSSRSVITGDAYQGVNEIGLPSEIAQRITFEERVTNYNIQYLQKLVDEKLCLSYTDGQSNISFMDGSKGHTLLRVGQTVHRQVLNSDTVFINRPPTTHKHSLQALTVYIHDDHTVKIHPLICGPLSADFDGDCVSVFYPQSLAAKAEALELFSVPKQLLCSHNNKLNLQCSTDSLLSLKILFSNCFLPRSTVQQLAMFLPNQIPEPAILKPQRLWTASQILQAAFPLSFNCLSDKYTVERSEILKIELSKGTVQSSINEILASIFKEKGPDKVLHFLNSVQPMLMENLFNEGFTVDLKDFYIPKDVIESTQNRIQQISHLLDAHLRLIRKPIADFVLGSSGMGMVIDSKSDSAIGKVVQQVGFLGNQLSDKGKLYSKSLVGDIAALFQNKYPFRSLYPLEEFGLVRSSLFHGLDSFQLMVHSIAAREVIVRSSSGLAEPGTLFKNLMAILRDITVSYDGTVRNVSSNSIIQFQYGDNKADNRSLSGEPVGTLAATAISNSAYKAVLDSSPSSNSSWELMKEILLCSTSFKNSPADRQVTLYLNDCKCGEKYCQEKAACVVKNHLYKLALKDIAVDFLIEHRGQQVPHEGCESLLGHVHMNKVIFQNLHISMHEVCEKVQNRIVSFLNQKGKKKVHLLFKRLKLSSSECCIFGNGAEMPCLTFYWQGITNENLQEKSQTLAQLILPVILQTIIKGDPRVSTANIVWIYPGTNPSTNQDGECAVEIVLERNAVKKSGAAWRVAMDSCLPIIHLIDTTRSTPKAIKQVEELLGISCVVDLAVQRLSTSVNMVTKDILKEHLILVADSISHSGSMVGFNQSGIKALSRSSNVQGPFANTTLFTPKKCFKKAAEKSHDSLSSIVPSCIWGKQVSVGTGSPFDILWDTREASKDQQDVHDFLLMMRSPSGKEADNGFLSTDVDELDADCDAEECMSPENGPDKATFDDTYEFGNDSMVRVGDFIKSYGNWGQTSSSNSKNNRNNWIASNTEIWGKKSSSNSKDSGKKRIAINKGNWGQKPSSNFEDDGSNWIASNKGNWGQKSSSNFENDRNNWIASRKGNPGQIPSSNSQNNRNNWIASRKGNPGQTPSSNSQNNRNNWIASRKGNPGQIPSSNSQNNRNNWIASRKGNPGQIPSSNSQDSRNNWIASRKGNPGQTPSSNSQDNRNNWIASNNRTASEGWGSTRAGKWNQKVTSGPRTVTGKKMAMSTSKEQEMLQVIEPIMQSIKRIMQQYDNGCPLSDDDKYFILENVFQYHPDRAAKMGVGIKSIRHVMVNKHRTYQKTRCLYVVLINGHEEDFSYNKCLANFVKTKHPDLIEAFNRKYSKQAR